MKLVSAFFKDDPVNKELKKINLANENLQDEAIAKGLTIFQQKRAQEQQQSFLKVIVKQLEQKSSCIRKFKILMLLLEISKLSKYDVSDIILNKKIKVFAKPGKTKPNELENKIIDNLQNFVSQELLIPIHNYMMKLSTNEELYNTCRSGEIPFDDIFRRGTKIRFIWIFKLYNLINLLIPILNNLIKVIRSSPSLKFITECLVILFNDMCFMNNFIVKALEEASKDNFMLMPYFDMLQFNESLKEQKEVGKKIREVYIQVKEFCKNIIIPVEVKLTKQEVEEIELQALRVKLISNSLKNPKKDHKVLQTEYNERTEEKDRKSKYCITQNAKFFKDDFQSKYSHLDRGDKV